MTKQIIVERITNDERQSSIWAAGCYYVACMSGEPYYYEFGKSPNEARKKLLAFKKFVNKKCELASRPKARMLSEWYPNEER